MMMTKKTMNRRVRKVLADTHGAGPQGARRILNMRKPDDSVTAAELQALGEMEDWKRGEELIWKRAIDACLRREAKLAEFEGREMRPMLTWLYDERVIGKAV